MNRPFPLPHSGHDSGDIRTRLERLVARFEAGCRPGADWPEIDAYLAEADEGWRGALLVELIHADLELRMRYGKPSRLGEILSRHFPGGEPAEIAAELRLRERELAGDRESEPPSEIDRFTLGEELGRGATSIVYRAFDERLRRAVAFKRLRGELLGSEDAVARFIREARHVAGLRHPGIVRLYEAGRTDGCCFLAMELIPGETLARSLSEGRYPPRRVADLVAQVADALEYAHAEGIVHRDVKPSNILLDAEGRPYLTDFGLSSGLAGDGTLTEDGQILGTPAYMSPEQARGDIRRVDARSDVYSLGVVLYELLTGVVPFRGSPRMVLAQVVDEDPRSLRRLDDSVPRDLETVCLKAIAKDPGRRYQRAADLAGDLRRWLDGRPVLARPLGVPARLWRRCRRRPALTGLAVALVLTLLGLAGMYAKARIHLEDSRRQAARFREGMESSSRIASQLASMVPSASAPGFDQARMESAIAQLKERIARIEDDPGCRDILARDYVILRSLYDRCRRPEEAAAAQEHAVRALESLMREGMDAARISEAADAVSVLAKLYDKAGRADQARDARLKAIDLDARADALWRDSGESGSIRDPRRRMQRFVSLLRLVEFDLERHRIDEAVRIFRLARNAADELLASGSSPALSQADLAKQLVMLAKAAEALGDPDEALLAFGQALQAYREMQSHGGDVKKALGGRAMCYHVIGRIHSEQGRLEEAERALRASLEVRRGILSDYVPTKVDRDDFEGTRRRLAEVEARLAGRTAAVK